MEMAKEMELKMRRQAFSSSLARPLPVATLASVSLKKNCDVQCERVFDQEGRRAYFFS